MVMISSIANGNVNQILSLVFTVSRLLILYLPLVWLLSQYLGLQGIYVVVAVANTIIGLER